jgi:hypothetical protein
MIKVLDINNNLLEEITFEYYQSDEYLQRLYLDCMIDVYSQIDSTIKLYTHEEFKKIQGELKKIKKGKVDIDVEERKKINNERFKKYYHDNKEIMKERYKEYYKNYKEKHKKIKKELNK